MKKLLVLKNILLCVAASMMLSCSTIRYTTTKVQTLNPPTKNINLPDTAKIAIVALFSNVDDSLNITNMAMSLKEQLEHSPKYSSYIFPVYTIKAMGENITTDRIDELRYVSGADYLIVIENFSLLTGNKKSANVNNFMDYSYTQISLMTIFNASFKIYDTHGLQLIDNNQMNDTISLVTNKYSWESSEEEVLPDKKTIVSIVSDGITEIYAKTIAPYWQEETRYYYIAPEIEIGKEYIENEEWDDAMKLWMKYVDNSNKTLAAVCCFNMALGCEMIGEYDLALKWIDNVKRKDEKYYWEEYKRTLEKRIVEKKLIDNILH